MKRWRVGMVGYGWAAGAHIGALELIDRFEVAAVCTSREDIDAAGLERAHGHPIELVRDFDELIARPDIDVIDLCSRSEPACEPGDRRRARRQAPDHREADRARPRGHARRRGGRRRGRGAHVRLPPGALLAAVHDDEEPRRRRPDRRAALRRGRLLPQHRPRGQPVRVEPAQGRRRQQPAHRGLPRARRADDVHGRRGHGGRRATRPRRRTRTSRATSTRRRR